MKKIFALTILALAFVTSAFAQKVYPDPNGNTSFTQYTTGVTATNIGNTTVNVRFVQPGLEFNLVLVPGQSQFLPGNGAFYEWTCPLGQQAYVVGTYNLPTYANFGERVSCR
jgi:hypothetical protein